MHRRVEVAIEVLVVGPYRSINPYCGELAKALAARPAVTRLSYGPLRFWHGRGPFDIVHLHFPELLTGYHVPSSAELTAVTERLEWWRAQGSTIVATLHDRESHNTSGDGFADLFEAVFCAADLIVHLGTSSAADARRAGWCVQAEHVVIPHHLFSCFGPPTERLAARRRLDIAPDGSTVVVTQTLRSVDEVDLIDAATQVADLVVVAGATQAFDRATADTVAERLRRLGTNPRVRLLHRTLTDREVADIVSAADVAMVARMSPCNSGGVALGTGLARVVVGPDVGNVGSSLREIGNPTFDPARPATVAESVRRGLELAGRGHGEIAHRHAARWWSAPCVAEAHVRSYLGALRPDDSRRPGANATADLPAAFDGEPSP